MCGVKYMKKEKLWNVIAYGLCAIFWVYILIQAIVVKEYEEAIFSFVLHIIAAILFIERFIEVFLKYRNQNSDE